MDLEFYRDKRVLLTGHTGFKGSWMSKVLVNAGAELMGYSTMTPRTPKLFELAGLDKSVYSVKGDVRDLTALKHAFDSFKPQIVIHMAAQPIVRRSYEEPVYTYDTNVMGTVNVLECVRASDSVRSVLNVTTDKVYRNDERLSPYGEDEPLDGRDPYSNSKSCSELVTRSYYNSFLRDRDLGVSTARAGNVIGGGDFARDRIIPDCVRAVLSGNPISVRNPNSVRPYQSVLEPIMAYLMLAQWQYGRRGRLSCYNVGPDEEDCISTRELVELFCQSWGEGARWICAAEPGAAHEARLLKLDCSRLKRDFDWQPVWHIAQAIDRTCRWTKTYCSNENVPEEMDRQISEYCDTACFIKGSKCFTK